MRPIRHRLKQILIFQLSPLVLLFSVFGCATSASPPPASQGAVEESASLEPRQLKKIQVEDQNGYVEVLLVGSGPMTYTAFKAIDPLRLVVDLPDAKGETLSSPMVVENQIIGKIEIQMIAEEPRPMTRVEIGLNRESPYEISQEDNQIRLQFRKTPGLAGSEPVEGQPPPEPEEKVSSQEMMAREEAAAPKILGEQGAFLDQKEREENLPPASKITGVDTVPSDDEITVYIVGDGSFHRINAFHLVNPPRVALDVFGVQSALKKAAFPISHPLVDGVRLGRYKDKVRIVFDVVPAAGVPYQVKSEDNRIVVSFEPGPGFPDRRPTVMPSPASLVKAPVSAHGSARITSIDFNLLDSNKTRLAISANRPLEPEVHITGANSFSLILPNANLPKHLQRHLDTGQFSSAVNLIDPRPMKGFPDTVEFHIEMREMVPYHVTRDDNTVFLVFDSSPMPPPKPIQLDKPLTVVEARTPAASAPVSIDTETAVAPEPAFAPSAGEPGTEMVAIAEETGRAAAEKAPPSATQAARYVGQRISLDLQDVDVRNVLRLLADVTGKNIVVEPNVKGTVTLKVDSVPWDQVLDLVLKINDLDKVTEGNVIRIATTTKIQGELDRKKKEVEAQKELLAAAMDLGEITTEYLQVNYASVTDIASQIEKVKSDKGTLSVDERTNLIILSDFPKRIETAREILAKLDVATQQVMIESRIVSANTNFSRNLGISWNVNYQINSLENRLGGPVDLDFAVAAPLASVGTAGVSFTRTATNLLDLDMQLFALENSGEGRVISSPRIFTLDHVQAMIQQGDQIPYPQRTEEGTISTAFAPATLSLTVTPHITPDGKVRLEVQAKKDEADFSRTVQEVPAIRTQEAKTELLVNDGDTIVIGGIVIIDKSWSEERVPYLWRIPVLGWLFKNRSVVEEKTELLIFLSPSIVKS